VHVLPTLQSGGAEQQVLALCRALDPEVWEPRVVCTHRYDSLEPEFRAAGIPIEVVGKRSRYDLALVWRLAQAIRRHNPDIVHTWLVQANTWGRAACLFLPSRPVVIASERTINAWLTLHGSLIDRALSRTSDMVVGNSRAVTDFQREAKRVAPEKLATIRNGITLERAQRCLGWSVTERVARRQELGLAPDSFVVGNIAQPTPEKRWDLLAEVLTQLRQLGVPARVLQLGRDPDCDAERVYLDDFRDRLNDGGVAEFVHRRGFVRDVSADLAAMDAFVQTSDVEGFPNGVTEALAMELPVVATAAGGTPDLVTHRQTGWLTATADVDDIVRGLSWVYANRESARALGIAGRNRVEERFSVDSLVRNTTALYRCLLRRVGHWAPAS